MKTKWERYGLAVITFGILYASRPVPSSCLVDFVAVWRLQAWKRCVCPRGQFAAIGVAELACIQLIVGPITIL